MIKAVMECGKLHFTVLILGTIVTMGLMSFSVLDESHVILKTLFITNDDILYQPRPRAVPGVNVSRHILQEQSERLQKVETVCNKLNITETFTPSKSFTLRLMVDDRNKILFGYIPKVGCTTWKGVFGRVRHAHGGNSPNFWRLSLFNDSQREQRLRDYKKVLFVRNPIIRLLSAYLSKFRNLNKLQQTWENMYGYGIIKKYRPGSENLLEYVKRFSTYQRPFINITLSEFIRFITDNGDKMKLHEISDHWLPQNIVSHICHIRYDFIGKYENLAVEAPFVLKWLGLENVVGFPEVHQSKATDAILNEYSDVPLSQIQALRRYYSNDFDLFGYDSRDTVLKIAEGIFDIDT